ncbi:class F sortase [Modestobacter sp. URMC 112]
MRITGAYPPPPPPPSGRPAPVPPGVELPGPDRPRVTRYDRSRGRSPRAATGRTAAPRPAAPARHRSQAPRTPRPHAARAWAATSGLLAAAGVASVVVLPGDGSAPVRLDVPVVVVAAPATVPPAAVPPAPGPVPAPAPPLLLPAADPVRVRVPALGATSEVVHLGLRDDGTMEVPSGAEAVGWYDRSPTPGQLGPAVLAGHVDWDGEAGAFAGLDELLPGDQVVVERADGAVATFAVERVEEHDKDAFPADAVYGDLDHAGLRLITCGGGFDEDTGDYELNVVVFARLVATA